MISPLLCLFTCVIVLYCVIALMSRPTKISPDIVGSKLDLGTQLIKPKESILYALGIGFSTGTQALKQIHSIQTISNLHTSLTKDFQVACLL